MRENEDSWILAEGYDYIYIGRDKEREKEEEVNWGGRS